MKTIEKVRAKDLVLGKKYILECGIEAYLIAIDRVNRKPIYVFAYENDIEVDIKVFRNLTKVKKILNDDVDEKLAKIAFSIYVTKNSFGGNESFRKRITIYNNKIIEKLYFENNRFKRTYGTILSEKTEDFWGIEYTLWRLIHKKYGKNARLKNVRVEDDEIKYDIIKNSKEKVTESYSDTLYMYVFNNDKITDLPKNAKIYSKIL